jgi:uncharacterized membrane protein YgdD (TMEM256/DUF423 family)
MERLFLQLAGVNGLLAVALGAFGAHGLKTHLEGLEDAAKRLDWWQTAAQYQLTHALALALASYLASQVPGRCANVAGWGFQLGILLFSGSLYVMTLTGVRALGAVTPLGGLGLLVGWVAVIVAAGKLGNAS